MFGATALDAVFSALGDPTRRQIVERLARGRLSITEVASGIPMSQPAISKHVKILERSGLIEREVSGRVHRLRLTPKAMEAASSWIERQRRYWNQALDRLDVYLAQTSPTPKRERKKR
jgi:DNA-binding transcriptional ArsR family regulator